MDGGGWRGSEFHLDERLSRHRVLAPLGKDGVLDLQAVSSPTLHVLLKTELLVRHELGVEEQRAGLVRL